MRQKTYPIKRHRATVSHARHARCLAAVRACGIEALEPRQLFSTIDVASFGATPDTAQNQRSAIQAAINAAHPGDTVSFPAGTFDIHGSLTLRNGVTLLFAPSFRTDLIFHVGSGSAFVSAGPLTNATLGKVGRGADIVSTGDVLTNFFASANLSIIGNRMKYGTGGKGEIFAVYLATPIGQTQNGLRIEYNDFHDSPNTDRNWEIWYARNATLNFNTFFNVHDGGHLMDPQGNVSFSYNTGTELQRMGQEIEGYADSSQPGLTVVGNAFYDWKSLDPDGNSFALSVVANYTPDVVVKGNYLAATIAPGGDARGRFGFAIEVGGENPVVEDNTIVGSWVAAVSAAEPALIEDNDVYGQNAWGTFAGEEGQFGMGSFTAVDNTTNPNPAAAPAPLSAKADTEHSILLTWSDNIVQADADPGDDYVVIVRSQDKHFKTGVTKILLSETPGFYVDDGLAAGTRYYYRIYTGDSQGLGAGSAVMHAQTPASA